MRSRACLTAFDSIGASDYHKFELNSLIEVALTEKDRSSGKVEVSLLLFDVSNQCGFGIHEYNWRRAECCTIDVFQVMNNRGTDMTDRQTDWPINKHSNLNRMDLILSFYHSNKISFPSTNCTN